MENGGSHILVDTCSISARATFGYPDHIRRWRLPCALLCWQAVLRARGKRLASFQNGFPVSRSLGGSHTDSQQREKCPLGGELGCPRHKYLHPSQPDWPVLGWATWDFVEDLRMNRYPSNLHKQALLKSAGVHTVDGEE